MSTSEFEGGSGGESGFDAADPSEQNRLFPGDFSDEDADFAQELRELFSLDSEEVPPLFVQTLMAAEDPRFQPVEHAFEKKVSAHVFRRLHIKRRLFRSTRFSMRALHLNRTMLPFVAAWLVFVLLTVVITGPSFAAGLTYLWSGRHSGVVQVNKYPTVPTPDKTKQHPANKQINMIEAQDLLHFPLYWPQSLPNTYTQDGIYLYPGDQNWADGPVAVLTFSSSANGQTRQIAICEFKPQGRVLQVVQNGAAHRIKIGRDGSSGIYVEGQWKQSVATDDQPSWVYSNRSELIYEDPDSGIVFWIVGDKRDGIDSEALSKIALSLSLLKVEPAATARIMHRLDNEIQDIGGMPFANDVVYLDDPNNASGPSFMLVHSSDHHGSLKLN